MNGLATQVLVVLLTASVAAAQPRVEQNIVYGTYSGTALLMNVHHPLDPNGYGLILIPGSGWDRQHAYNAGLIKDGGSAMFVSVPRLLEAGYTLFVVSHRAAPRFRYPAAVEDVRRATQFVRYHASEFGIQATQIGAVGYSSGAHLAILLGELDDAPDATDDDPVSQVSSRVQCVVASAAPTDLTRFRSGEGVHDLVSFMGSALRSNPDPAVMKVYRAASPVTHVSASSAPLLLIHGDADDIVPFQQAELMVAAAEQAGATVRLLRIPGGDHIFARHLDEHPEWPDVLGETERWLDQHLRPAASR